MTGFRNVFACLAHESAGCVLDLVRNLRHLDPESVICLYNGGDDPSLFDGIRAAFDSGAVLVHPRPRRMRWGWLHSFALDCIGLALEHGPFDTLTIVDSDQLCIRSGYSRHLAQFLANKSNVGLLGNAPEVQTRELPSPVAASVYAELDLWKPFLRRFPDGELNFPRWTFWPSTVIMHAAARELVALFSQDKTLERILAHTKIWASEEILFPSLVGLLGYQVMANPCRYDYVRHRASYTIAQIDSALSRSHVYWIHPVPRQADDPTRAYIRAHFNHYRAP